MKNLLIKIASIATELDYAGLTKEAKQMDSILMKLANYNKKPEFDYSRIPTDMAIDRMDNPEKIRMYLAMQRHVEKLNIYLRNLKNDLKNKHEFMLNLRIKQDKEKWEEENKGIVYNEQNNFEDARNQIRWFQQIIKKIEDEIDMFEAEMRKLNKHGIYDPDSEYDNGYLLNKRTIFHKLLGKDPKRNPNF